MTQRYSLSRISDPRTRTATFARACSVAASGRSRPAAVTSSTSITRRTCASLPSRASSTPRTPSAWRCGGAGNMPATSRSMARICPRRRGVGRVVAAALSAGGRGGHQYAWRQQSRRLRHRGSAAASPGQLAQRLVPRRLDQCAATGAARVATAQRDQRQRPLGGTHRPATSGHDHPRLSLLAVASELRQASCRV
jgi:hypothetical protein